MWGRSPHEALRLSVAAIADPKVVGNMLRKELTGERAGDYVTHRLTPSRGERFNLDQIVLLFNMAKAKGQHAGFELFAELCGYRVSAVVDPREQAADDLRLAQTLIQRGTELSERVLEQMRHGGINVEAVR